MAVHGQRIPTLPEARCEVLCDSINNQRYHIQYSQWRRQLGGTGARAPSTSNNLILVHFGVGLKLAAKNV